MVCNEADIIETTLRHNLTVLDLVVVVCNPSIDGTDQIIDSLVSEGLPIIPWRRSRNIYDQDGLLSSLYLRIQDSLEDPSMIVFDADELIVETETGALKAELSELEAGRVGQLKWRTYLPYAGSDGSAAFDTALVTERLADEVFDSGKPVRRRGTKASKHRPVPRGCHRINAESGQPIPSMTLRNAHLAHVPVRSWKQAASKSLAGWSAKTIATARDLKPVENRHWREISELIRQDKAGNSRFLAAQYAGLGYVSEYSANPTIVSEPASLPKIQTKYNDLIQDHDLDRSIVLRVLDMLRPRPGATNALNLINEVQDEPSETNTAASAFPVSQHLEAPKCDWAPIAYACLMVSPRTVVDFGCGLGLYLNLIKREFGAEVIGIDGSQWTEAHRVKRDEFLFRDLADDQVRIDQPSDLAICLEVVEHLPETAALNLAEQVAANASKALLFSAGQPDQPGSGHINLRPPEYWLDFFRERGWHIDPLATLSIRFLATFHWFRKNIFVLRPQPSELPHKVTIEASLMRTGKQIGAWPPAPVPAIFSYPGESDTYPVSEFFGSALSRFPSNTYARRAPSALAALQEGGQDAEDYGLVIDAVKKRVDRLTTETTSLVKEREQLRRELAHAKRYPWKYLRGSLKQRLRRAR